MTLTDLKISSRYGGNGRPHAGVATFSDGRRFDWFTSPVGLHLTTTVKTHQGAGRSFRVFSSPQREALILAAIA